MPSKFWNHVGFLTFLVAAVAIFATPATGQPAVARNPGGLAPDAFRPGRLIVQPKAGREAELAQFHRGRGVTLRKRYPALGRLQVLNLPPGLDTFAVIEAYRRSGLVESVE